MLEKEIKILEINREEIERQLLSLGASKILEGYIHDVYYDFPDDAPKNKMQANGRIFRLRKKGEEHIYTIKNKRKKISKKEGIIAKDEHETQITDIQSFTKVLEKYGMSKTREKKKYRVSYSLGDMQFDFDCYDSIPELLEIEGPNNVQIEKWIHTLGLDSHKRLLGGSQKLFRCYGIKYNYLDEK